MIIKRICVLLAISILFSMLFGCSQKTPTQSSAVDETQKETRTEEETESIDLSFLEPQSNKIVGWAGMSEAVKDSFSRAYPELEIDITDNLANPFVPDRSADLQTLGAAIASNDQPDFMELRMSATEAYYSNLYDPVQRYLEVDPNYNMKDVDSYVLDSTTFNDVIYFMPDNFTSEILVWNKEIFENVGLDPEKPPETWDELKKMNEKLLTYNADGSIATVGMIPMFGNFAAFTWDRWNLAAFGQDAHYVDTTRLKFQWDTPEYLETFEFIRSLQDVYGGISKLPQQKFDFFNGKVGFILWSATQLPVMSMAVNFEYGFSLLPKHDKDSKVYVPGNLGCIYGIPKGAKNPAGGWKMITHRLSDGYIEEAITIYNETPTGFLPAYVFHKPTREKLIAQFEPLMDEELVEMMKKRDEIELSKNISFYTSPVEGPVMTYFYQQAPKILSYELSTKEFLKQMQSYSDSLLDDFMKQKKEEKWTFEDGKDGIPPKQ